MTTEIFKPNASRVGSTVVFDNDQRAYLNSPYSHKHVVIAGPGAGKTTIAIQRVIDIDSTLSSNKSAEHPVAVLFLSFSRASISAAAKSMSTDLANLDIEFQAQTIDSLAYEICRYDGQMSLLELEQTEFADRLKIASQIADEEGTNLTYDLCHVFIDEAQDVSPSQADFLKKYLANLPPDCGVTVFADPDQEIYRFLDQSSETQSRWDYFHSQLEEISTWESYTLHGQYRAQSRSMQSIFETLAAVRDERNRPRKAALVDRLQSHLPTITLERLAKNTASKKSQSVLLTRNNAAIGFCFDRLRRSGYSKLSPVFPNEGQEFYPSWIGEVACSMPESDFTSHELKEKLETLEIQHPDLDPVSHLNLNLLRRMDWEDLRKSYAHLPFHQKLNRPGDLVISTIHQAKGLEFDDVAILDPDKLLLCEPPEVEVLFVALSRARRMTFSLIPPDNLSDFRTNGRRLAHYRYIGKRRLLRQLSILPSDITVPSSLGASRAEKPEFLDLNSFMSFEPIRSRNVFSYICKVDDNIVGETTEEFGRILQANAGTAHPPNLGSVPIAAIETRFVRGRGGLRPILVPTPCGISEIQ